MRPNKNGVWELLAIVRGQHQFQWKDDVCDFHTKNVTLSDYQAIVPFLSWIHETIGK